MVLSWILELSSSCDTVVSKPSILHPRALCKHSDPRMIQHIQSIEQEVSTRDLDAILRIMDTIESFQYHYDANIRQSAGSTSEIMPSPLQPPEDVLPWGIQSADMFCRAKHSPMTRGLETGYLDQTGVWHRMPENNFNFWNHVQPLPPYLPLIPEIAPGPSHPFYASPYMSDVSTPFQISSSLSTSTISLNLQSPCLLQTPVFIDRPLEPSPTVTAATQSKDPLLAHYFRDISQTKERDLLVQVLNSEWLAANEPEPQYMGKSILVGFLHRNSLSSPLSCRFDGCERIFDRQDRAVAHIRRQHLKYEPYACGGACGKVRCQERFSNLAYRRGHINKTKGTCHTCGKELTRKNLPRHSATCGNATRGKIQRSTHDI